MKNYKNSLSRGLQYLSSLSRTRPDAAPSRLGSTLRRRERAGYTVKYFAHTQGSIITEFALIAPILLVLILGIVDFGAIISKKISLHGALEAGTLYASKNSSDTAGIQAAVLDASNLTGVTVTTTQYCECSDGTQPACGSICADASQLATYISITANLSVTTLMTYPGVANPYPLSVTTRIRVQ